MNIFPPLVKTNLFVCVFYEAPEMSDTCGKDLDSDSTVCRNTCCECRT